MCIHISWIKEYALKITLLFTNISFVVFVHNVYSIFKEVKRMVNRITTDVDFS